MRVSSFGLRQGLAACALASLVASAAPSFAAEPLRLAADSVVTTATPAAPACVPLLLDPSDMGFGSAVVYSRIPSTAEVHDLQYIESVQHLVIQLPAWPAGLDALQPLAQAPLPEGVDLIVVLPGYPETRAAAEAWNLLRRPLRLVLVVDGPPVDRSMIQQLNAIRGLERVVANMPRPSRSGFERLQRPLSFRVVMP